MTAAQAQSAADDERDRPGLSESTLGDLLATGADPAPPTSVDASRLSPRVRTGRIESPLWLRQFLVSVVAVDALAAGAAGLLAYILRFGDPSTPVRSYLAASLAMPLLWVAFIATARGYAVREIGIGTEEFRRVFQAGIGMVALIGFASYAAKLEIARGYVVVAIPLTMLLTIAGRYLARKRLHVLRRDGRCMKTVVAVGRERAVLELVQQLRRDRYCGMEVIAACVPDPDGADLLRAANVPIYGDLGQASEVVRTVGAEAVAVTSSSETAAVYLRQLSWDLEGSGVELLVAPGLIEIAGPRLHIRPFVGLPLLHVEEPEFTGIRRVIKGAMDRLVSALALGLFSPILLGIAIAVRCTSPGPIFFKQERVGIHGKPFMMIKFRTMVVDAEARLATLSAENHHDGTPLFKVKDDPRITRVGKFLRRYSLDELPQLINIVRGTMSLVGPRPPLPSEVALYDDSARRRLLVKPGLTGLWQVSGRSDLPWEEAVRLDLRYVENWSLALDFLILWKTVFAIVKADGAY